MSRGEIVATCVAVAIISLYILAVINSIEVP